MPDEEKNVTVETTEVKECKNCETCKLIKKFLFLSGAIFVGTTLAILLSAAILKPNCPCHKGPMKGHGPIPGIERQMPMPNHGGFYRREIQFHKGPQNFQGHKKMNRDFRAGKDFKRIDNKTLDKKLPVSENN